MRVQAITVATAIILVIVNMAAAPTSASAPGPKPVHPHLGFHLTISNYSAEYHPAVETAPVVAYIDFHWPTPPPPVVITHTPAVEAAVAANSLTYEEFDALYKRAAGPPEWEDPLYQIGTCESHLTPSAVGDSGHSLGMFQLWTGWAKDLGGVPNDLFDPFFAMQTAIHVRATRGHFGGGGGWTCADILGIP